VNFKLRQAVIDDSTRIKFLVREAHLNPLGLDWRRFTVAVTPQEGIIGCGQIKTHRDGSRELASVVVDPIWRGEGIAKEVINHPYRSTLYQSISHVVPVWGIST